MTFLRLVLGIVLVLVGMGWLGLQVKPAPFDCFASSSSARQFVPLPGALPTPVERFYRITYGERVPIIDSAVICGRGSMRLFGLAMPIRFRFTHEAGRNFRHDIDLTWFGFPLMRVFETYIDGTGWANTPGIHEGKGFDQGSNVSLWGEALNWFPALLLTDSRVQWQAVDDTTALLKVPNGTGQEVLVVRFEPEAGTIQYIEAMKFKTATNVKALWINGIWFEDGRPWIHFDVDEIVYNADVYAHIHAARPE